MPPNAPSDLLAGLRSRRELIEGDLALPADLSLPTARALTERLRSCEPPAAALRLGIVHTYTSDLLDPWLDLHAAVQGLELAVYHAPYGLSPLEAQPGSGLAAHDPDLTLLLLTREDLHPRLAEPVAGLDGAGRAALVEAIVANLADILGRFRGAVGGRLALSVLPPLAPLGLGLYDAQAERSEGAWWGAAKGAIAALLRDGLGGATLLDMDDLLADLGREGFFDRRLWYSARWPFSVRAAFELARRAIVLGAVDKLPRAKVIVLDADNTLWGGIVGEDGIDGIALGPEYPGNAFVDFQRRLLDYRQRGFLLALCSKNNPEDVDEVLRNHPHQVLRDRHFAARRVNWQPKSENLVALAEELSLGLDAFVFVDDSAHECAAIRRELPQVTVIRTPAKPVAVPGCLDRLARLEILSLTAEDLAKTEMYAQERQRRELKDRMAGGGSDPQAYLASLDMRMRIAVDERSQLARLVQLTQKTNQFNLTTRRYGDEQLAARIADPHWTVASFSLADVFGDSGIVGLAMIHRPGGGLAELETFLMSCRVIGRTAETAFLEALVGYAIAQGVETLVADYIPTAKNRLVADFLPRHRFVARADGRFSRDLTAYPALPGEAPAIAVTLGGPAATAYSDRPLRTDPNSDKPDR